MKNYNSADQVIHDTAKPSSLYHELVMAALASMIDNAKDMTEVDLDVDLVLYQIHLDILYADLKAAKTAEDFRELLDTLKPGGPVKKYICHILDTHLDLGWVDANVLDAHKIEHARYKLLEKKIDHGCINFSCEDCDK